MLGELARLETRIKEQRAKGQNFVRFGLTRELDRARRQTRLLEQQLWVQRGEASRFTARFARYETLKGHLARVDEQHRDLEKRLIEVRTKAPAPYA